MSQSGIEVKVSTKNLIDARLPATLFRLPSVFQDHIDIVRRQFQLPSLTVDSGLNTQFSLADLLRQSAYSRLAGYEDLNDAERVSADPTFRLIGSPKRWDRGGALTSTLHWFETELLTQEENLAGLRAVNREVLAQAEMATPDDRIVLDMDSSESPVHGAQEGSAYNGHFESVCYHPLFLFTEHGDCLAATLRPGNVHSGRGLGRPAPAGN